MTCLDKKAGRFRPFMLSVFLCLFGFHPVWADDTEIFFSPISSNKAQPNILLVLDASASMLNKDGGTTTRLQRMNDAMIQVLNRINNVNVGVMRFSNKDSGGSIIYPVRDLESTLCDGIPCASSIGHVGSITTARQEILDTITSMEMQWATPTLAAMLEAEAYFSGGPVVYGKKRVFIPCESRTGNAKTRCYELIGNTPYQREEPRVANVSHPDSYSGGEVINRPAICDEDPTNAACAEEEIIGNAVYTSPIVNECQSNHILLVTDGFPTVESVYTQLSGRFNGCEDSGLGSDKGRCLIELTDYMANNDLRDGVIDGDQTVTTHTVGFNLNSPWLERVASGTIGAEGAGGYHTASSTDELVEALVAIIEGVQKVDSTFVAPGVTVDQFSRLAHRKDTYLALFEPSNTPRWPGNMKRYDLSGGALFDASEPPIQAVNGTTGQFEPTSKSYWSSGTDGHSIAAGGAAAKLPGHTLRNAVTYTGSEASLLHHTNELSTDNIANLVGINSNDTSNLAPSGVARQSNTSHSGIPGRAIDSNTNGAYTRRSVTHTDVNGTVHWWELDLRDQYAIDQINIFGRTDSCCTHRLSDVNVYLSEVPFGNLNNEDIKANQDIWHHFHAGEISQAVRPYTVSPDTVGRYLRIQLDSPDNSLSLAEVQVMGGKVADSEIARVSNIIEWARGKDVDDADSDGLTTDTRHYLGDPLHSSPHLITYGGTSEDPDSVVFMGTNEGYLHAFSSRTGIEEFAFMPKELIPNLDTLYENSKFVDKVYGMDGKITSWINDQNKNGIIEDIAGDHAYLYAGMRRGGSSYYALDVSDRDDPKFLFQIPSVDPIAYAELGQSWSEPTLATIKVDDTIKKVLIFAGGYDESQDNKTTYSPDSTGRAVFIADAEDGSLIWSGQPTAKTGLPVKAFSDMQYSIPSNIKVIDPDGDGLASQFYVGDMGGQLWRFDIKNGNTGIDLVDGGVIAQFGDQSISGARRFFHEPDLVLNKYDGKVILTIGIGSGYRAHPLDLAIDDRYYQLRYPFKDTGHYGMKVEAVEEGETVTRYRPVTEADMFDTTANLIGQGKDTEISDARQLLSEKQGWLIRMERDGEKILGASATLDGVVRFISYVPSVNTVDDKCSPSIGKSYYWRVGLGDGTPLDDQDSDGNTFKDDRWVEVPGGGIAPPVTTVFVSDPDGDVVPNDVSGINVLHEGHDVNTVRRWYWAENPE